MQIFEKKQVKKTTFSGLIWKILTKKLHFLSTFCPKHQFLGGLFQIRCRNKYYQREDIAGIAEGEGSFCFTSYSSVLVFFTTKVKYYK